MRAAKLLCLFPLLAACSETTTPSETGEPTVRVDRTRDLRIVQLREDLDLLRESEARETILGLGAQLEALCGVESYLLRARLFAMRGELNAAQPLIETARTQSPNDPRVYATAAEIYAAPGQFETATAEIRDGVRQCGMTPELRRAQGVLHLCKGEPSSAKRGLEKLQEALLEDPELPFMNRALGQAYLLCGRQQLSDGDVKSAYESVRSSLEYDPAEPDALHFRSEVYSALGEHTEAIRDLEKLIELGEPLDAELALTHKKAGVQLLVAHDRPGALEHFVSAREMGLTEEELGFGAQALFDESKKVIEVGLTELRDLDYRGAKDRFRKALHYDPKSLAARNHLGICHFKLGEFEQAADCWRTVLFEASELGLNLPDPVHINLSKALMQMGDSDGAMLALKDYLLDEPFGEFVDETRELVSLMQNE